MSCLLPARATTWLLASLEIAFQTRMEPGCCGAYLHQPASPKKAGKGRCREEHCWAWWSTPLALALALGCLMFRVLERAAKEREWAGDWRPCCPFSARGRCPHGPCSKKFRLQHLAVQGDDAHTDNPFAMATNSIKLLTGNSYPQLAQLVADRYVDAILEHVRVLLLAQMQAPA
jgi:hypothetical protein